MLQKDTPTMLGEEYTAVRFGSKVCNRYVSINSIGNKEYEGMDPSVLTGSLRIWAREAITVYFCKFICFYPFNMYLIILKILKIRYVILSSQNGNEHRHPSLMRICPYKQ